MMLTIKDIEMAAEATLCAANLHAAKAKKCNELNDHSSAQFHNKTHAKYMEFYPKLLKIQKMGRVDISLPENG